ncbi:MAG TPA: glycosyltransferase family 2 protein [Pseudobdellovibrionaceae bacterium]|nr:glycosyltransferase family 2 protein [Pseudobdellovibrionaceae bacterium]
MEKKKLISVVIPCFNEVENVNIIYSAVVQELEKISKVDFEILFIDNHSNDGTQNALRQLAQKSPKVKVILNNRNYGPIRSPFYGLLQTRSDAAILMAADFQEPPGLISEFIGHWLNGHKVVAGVKSTSQESYLKFKLRSLYYNILTRLSEDPLLTQFTGFALYDADVISTFRMCNDPYPYLRGLVSELGYIPHTVFYHQPERKFGKAKGTLKNMLNFGLLGLVSHSKVPLRIAIYIGMLSSLFSLLIAIIYFLYKILYWNSFQLGIAPLVIGMSFFSSVQLFFLGVVGEYVGITLAQVKKRPLVIEKERINFNL